MKRAIAVSGAILASALAFAGSSGALNAANHGAVCVAQAGSVEQAKVAYGLFGVHNVNTSTSLVTECGAVLAKPGTVTGVALTLYDRNSSADVCCLINLQNAGGQVVSAANRCSSGSSANAQFVQFNAPAGTVAATANLTCTIPPKTATGLSHVTSFSVGTQ